LYKSRTAITEQRRAALTTDSFGAASFRFRTDIVDRMASVQQQGAPNKIVAAERVIDIGFGGLGLLLRIIARRR
jgi:hypothetical protein